MDSKAITARTNAYELNWTGDGVVHHYNVVIRPNFEIKVRDDKEDRGLGKEKGLELIMRLQQVLEPGIFASAYGAFDGKKNLFSTQKYVFSRNNTSRMSFPNVPFFHDNKPNQLPNKTATIEIEHVNEINTRSLREFLLGKRQPTGTEMMAINMLNLFVQAYPKMNSGVLHNARSFFVSQYKKTMNNGLELWRGYFQSVRPTRNRLYVNVDVTVGVVIPVMPLSDLASRSIKARSMTRLSQEELGKLRDVLKGMKVDVRLPGHIGKKPKKIMKILVDVGRIQFEKDGQPVTVHDHFKKIHAFEIPPGSLGVDLGKAGVFPLAVCYTVEQLFKRRSSPEMVREAMQFVPQSPSNRFQIIQAGWQELRYSTSPFLLGAGIKINAAPIDVRGKLLSPPSMVFADSPITLQRPGTWDVMHKRFINPSVIQSWFVINLTSEDRTNVHKFVNDLQSTMEKRGMRVPPPKGVVDCNANSNIEAILRKGGSQFILAVLPEFAPTLYHDIKQFGDIKEGVITQCVKWSSKLGRDVRSGRADQYYNNLVLKINAKLGGVNCHPQGPAMGSFLEHNTMVVGADVSHPGAGMHGPSVAAMVTSWDKFVSKYCANIRLQDSRTEMMIHAGEMLHAGFENYRKQNNQNPKNIIYYRDGVSEGEYQAVFDQEFKAIRDVVSRNYKNEKMPGFIFIIVTKRHRTRFIADQSGTDPRGNGNIFSGFVVDEGIVHPSHQNFYLQSQPGLKGTSIPTHYTILFNNANLILEQIEHITYMLCHCYLRSTRSVKIPAPVYYADLVAGRAKIHFEDGFDISDTASTMSGETDRALHFYESRFKQVNERIKESMYFV